MQRFSVVVPAYNEVRSLPAVLEELRAALQGTDHEILVVDDGSTDGTAREVRPPVRLIRHPRNQGSGKALKSGLSAARAPIVVTFDADGQHNAGDIQPLLLKLAEGYDLAVGARRRLWGQPRGAGNLALSLLASALAGAWIPDITSGLRAMRKDKAMRFMDIYPDGFSFEIANTLAFVLCGLKAGFVPIEPRARQAGESKISPLRDGLRFALLIFSVAFSIHGRQKSS